MATTAVILVDDSDISRITYDSPNSSAWSNQGSPFEHNSTTHGLTGAGNATFTFNGTGVAAYGTIPQNTNWTGVKCNIDGKDYSYQGPSIITGPSRNEIRYHFEYCSTGVTALSGDQEHTFTITADPSISNSSGSGDWLFLDYILYNYASKNSSENAAVPSGTLANVVVDDGRTDLIKYDGPNGAQSWNWQGGSYEYNQTTHATTTGGANATFEFTGTRVEVFGTIRIGPRGSAFTSTYTIDGGPPVDFGSASLQANVTEYQMPLFQSPVLQDGKHKLVITSTTQSSLDYFLDYIVYATFELELTPTTSGSFSSPGASALSPTTATNPTSTGRSTNTGLIAGVSIAVVLVVLFGAVGFLLFLQKRKRKSKSRGEDTTTRPSAPAPSASAAPEFTAGSNYPPTPPNALISGLQSGAVSRSAVDISTGMGTSRHVVRHHDGGVHLRSDSLQEAEELPPVYQDQY